MTIRLQCPEGHSQDVIIDPDRTGNTLVARFLNTYKEEIAGLLDGTSKLYVIPPTPMVGRCCFAKCMRQLKATVME